MHVKGVVQDLAAKAKQKVVKMDSGKGGVAPEAKAAPELVPDLGAPEHSAHDDEEHSGRAKTDDSELGASVAPTPAEEFSEVRVEIRGMRVSA